MAAPGNFTLILVRHGENCFDKEERFGGWYDADLSEAGVKEAKYAGEKIKQKCYKFDLAYTSLQKCAIKTLFYIQEANDLHWVSVFRNWNLNNRMIGALQGLDRKQAVAKYGETQLETWRTTYDCAPPPIDEKDPMYTGNDPRYKSLEKSQIPKTESLKDTYARVIPYFECTIVPEIKKCQVILIVAHGNTIRAISKYLDKTSDKDIMELNIPTGMPLVYELDQNMTVVKRCFLATDEEVKAANEKIDALKKFKK